MFPNNTFQPNIRAVHTKIILHLWNKRADTQALVDSSATENFIHHWLIKWLNIPTTPLTQPRTARNINGSLNKAGRITEKVELKIQHQHHTKKLQFFVTNLGIDNMILGYPILAIANPELNWKKGKMKGAVVASTHDANKWSRKETPTTLAPDSKHGLIFWQFPLLVWRRGRSVINGCLEGPLSHKDQRDCRGGNKTREITCSSAADIYMDETIEKIQTQWMCLGHYVEQNTNREWSTPSTTQGRCIGHCSDSPMSQTQSEMF